jgi:hypothetical protein
VSPAVRAAAILLSAAVGLGGCADQNARSTPVPVVGTTYRVSPPQITEGSELTVDIMHDRKRCQQVFTNPDKFDERFFKNHEERLQSCVPKVDRASGQVQLSFRLAQRDNQNRGLLLALEKEHVRVRHMERDVPVFDFEQYNPSRVGQLFIVLVDASGSMRETDGEGISRMQRVQNALWESRKTFVNDEAAVAFFRFTTTVQGLAGQPLADVAPVTTVAALKDELSNLGPSSGWTHLYSAVRTGMGPLLDGETAVRRFLAERDMQPTVILLTDGFNNTHNKETCGDNASQLSEALQGVRAARRKPPGQRPELWTVGFGLGFIPGWKAPPDDITVSPDRLCGPYVHNQIDGGLDKTRIDNVSLEWLAQAGGGRAFVKADHRELQRAFEETAPRRYSWYKVKYRVDPFYHRTSFNTRVVLTQLAAADASVMFHPSAWFDAPTGLLPKGEDRWVEIGDIRRATGLAVPLLGLFIVLGFAGPAMFNTRRALFRRARGSGRKKK